MRQAFVRNPVDPALDGLDLAHLMLDVPKPVLEVHVPLVAAPRVARAELLEGPGACQPVRRSQIRKHQVEVCARVADAPSPHGGCLGTLRSIQPIIRAMALFEHVNATIYYEDRGAGFPLLLIAPGGMNSAIDWWSRAAFNPLETYAADFRLIAMDQRNAGKSRGPLDTEDPWGSYTGDQLALLDHLGIDRFHVMGCCIGCSYVLGLIQRAPARVAAAVLEQPIGIVEGNRELFQSAWRAWGEQLVARRDDIDLAGVEEFGNRMWSGEFVLSVTREFVRSCRTPLLVLPGIDQFHPGETGREIGRLAQNAEVLEPWKDSPELIQNAVERIRGFLQERTPGM